MVARNLNKDADSEDIVGAAGAEMAQQDFCPRSRKLLQGNISSSKTFSVNEKRANEVVGVGGNSRQYRNHLGRDGGLSVAVPTGETDEGRQFFAEGGAAPPRSTPMKDRVMQRAVRSVAKAGNKSDKRKKTKLVMALSIKGSVESCAARAFPPTDDSQEVYSSVRDLHQSLPKAERKKKRKSKKKKKKKNDLSDSGSSSSSSSSSGIDSGSSSDSD
jgi:hypothetical protein